MHSGENQFFSYSGKPKHSRNKTHDFNTFMSEKPTQADQIQRSPQYSLKSTGEHIPTHSSNSNRYRDNPSPSASSNNKHYPRMSYNSSTKNIGKTSVVDDVQPNYEYPLRQKSQDVMNGMKEFIDAGSGIVDRLGASMVNKANGLLTKYKLQKSALEESIQMLEKKIPAMTDQVNARQTLDVRFTSSPSSIEQAQRATSHTNYENHSQKHYQQHYRERSEASDNDDEDKVQIQIQGQQESSDRFREARAAVDNLKRKSSQIKQQIISQTPTRTPKKGADYISRPTTPARNSDIEELKQEYIKILDEKKTLENEYGKLWNELDTLENDRTILVAENTKLKKINEMQEVAMRGTKKSLKAAQNDILLLHGSTSEKIEDLRQMIKFSFEEIIDLQMNGENEEVIDRLREIEESLLASLKDNTALVQKFAKAQGQLDVTRKHFEKYEKHGFAGGEEEEEEYEPRNERVRGGQPGREDYNEMKKRLATLERVLEEKEKTYKELERKYQQIQQRWADKHEDSKKHIRVIEDNLETMLNKLEHEFSNKQEIINYIDTNLNKMHSQGDESNNEDEEEGEAKEWLEKENGILREGLLAALEKMKEVNRESQELKEILENSLEDFENALAHFEKKGTVRSNHGSGEKKGREVALEGMLRNVIYSLRDSLKNGVEDQKNNNQEIENIVSELTTDNRDLKEKVGLLLNKQKNHAEVVGSFRQNLDSAIREREDANREKDAMSARFEQLKQDWMSEKGVIEKYVEEVLQAINEVKKIEVKAEKQHEETERKLKEFWKQLENLQKNGFNSQ